jgi:hypothetical protein
LIYPLFWYDPDKDKCLLRFFARREEFCVAGEPVFTLEGLQVRLQDIQAEGWVPNARPGNDGGVGNTLEDLLGVTGHNHGTKFRIRQDGWSTLYEEQMVLL